MGSKVGIAWALASAWCLLANELRAQAPPPSAAPPSASFAVEPEPSASPPATPPAGKPDAAPPAPELAPAPPAPVGATSASPAPAPIASEERSDSGPDAGEATPAPVAFGDAGLVVIAGGFDVTIGRVGYSSSETTSFALNVSPSADYFVAEHLSFGAYVDIRHREDTLGPSDFTLKRTTNAVGVGVRGGIDVPLGSSFSLWLQGGVGFLSSRASQTAPPGTSSTVGAATVVASSAIGEQSVGIRFFAPILFHPVPHFFIGFGPLLSTDVWHEVGNLQNRATYVAATTTVGGWF